MGIETRAVVETAFGARYMKRLCKHFAHKAAVTLGEDEATIAFGPAVCRMEVDDAAMRVLITLSEPAQVERAEQMFADHLVRMADRDEPVVTWTRSA